MHRSRRLRSGLCPQTLKLAGQMAMHAISPFPPAQRGQRQFCDHDFKHNSIAVFRLPMMTTLDYSQRVVCPTAVTALLSHSCGAREYGMAQQPQTSHIESRGSARVDQPHLLRREQLVPPDPPAEQELSLLAGRDPVGLVDQLQRQALELGQRLQNQQSELDRREAEFHARIAKVENELRSARLVCAEREHELSEKLIEANAHTDPPRDPAAIKPIDRVDAAQAARVPTPASWRAKEGGIPVVNPTQNGTHWEARLAELEKSERLLQAQLAQLAFDRRKLDAEREALVERRQKQKEESTVALAESKSKFEHELLRLQTWSQKLERRNLAVEQLHQEASRMYREALEVRLCTEQLWAEINESVSPAESTQRISELRCKLMDQFHLASQRLSQQKEELEGLIERLDTHQDTLCQQRNELRHWIARRHAEIEADAEKLLNRERQLDRQDTEIARLKAEWIEQRHEYEQKIRRLSRLVNSATV